MPPSALCALLLAAILAPCSQGSARLPPRGAGSGRSLAERPKTTTLDVLKERFRGTHADSRAKTASYGKNGSPVDGPGAAAITTRLKKRGGAAVPPKSEHQGRPHAVTFEEAARPPVAETGTSWMNKRPPTAGDRTFPRKVALEGRALEPNSVPQTQPAARPGAVQGGGEDVQKDDKHAGDDDDFKKFVAEEMEARKKKKKQAPSGAPATPANQVPDRCLINVLGAPAEPSRADLLKGRQAPLPRPAVEEILAATVRAWIPKMTCLIATDRCVDADQAGKFGGKGWGKKKSSKRRKSKGGKTKKEASASASVTIIPKQKAFSGKGPRVVTRRQLLGADAVLEARSLGTCALVGNGYNLLNNKYGAEIDAHDTVFRYNGPTDSRFQAHVGKKTTIIWAKRPDGSNGFLGNKNIQPYKFHMFPAEWQQKNMVGEKGVLWPGPSITKLGAWSKFSTDLYSMYEEEMKAKVRTSTAGKPGFDKRGYATSKGFKRAIAVALSGLCSRVDLYGWTAGGGKYWGTSLQSFQRHLLPLEHWTYRTLQGMDNLCLYD